ncbi:hypothetical protein LINGRAHAP2_LOCUS23154 [Linum grandiflorum]
MKSSATSS